MNDDAHIYEKDDPDEACNETLSGNLRYSMDDHAHTYHKDDGARDET